jgi:hypothetical protein
MTQRRRDLIMRELIARTPALKGSPLFLFADHAGFVHSDILTHSWRDHVGNSHRLV